MKKVLISILSDYLIPNFLLIKEKASEYDKLVFITTQAMLDKRRGLFLERSLGLPDNTVNRIVVEEDNYADITNMLANDKSVAEGDKFIVNITGGTKIMSIAIYDYFKNKGNSTFYYIPIGKNVMICLNDSSVTDIKYRANLKEYFYLYGLTFEAKQKLMGSSEMAFELFDKCRKKHFYLKGVSEIRNAHNASTPNLRKYYSGEWFEEYTYLRLKNEFQLDDDSIVTGALLKRDSTIHINDNEIDVMFVKDNALFVGECKVGMFGFGKTVKATAEGYLYKLAAISKDFGLRVNSYLFTLQNLNDNKYITPKQLELLKDRAGILGVKGIVDCNIFKNSKNLI